MRKSKRPPPPAPFVLLREVLPELTKWLKADLRKSGLTRHLADQIEDLRIYGRCPCDAPQCGTFYCVSEAERKALGPGKDIGLSCVTVAKGKVTRVETLDPSVDDVLRRLFPEPNTLLLPDEPH